MFVSHISRLSPSLVLYESYFVCIPVELGHVKYDIDVFSYLTTFKTVVASPRPGLHLISLISAHSFFTMLGRQGNLLTIDFQCIDHEGGTSDVVAHGCPCIH